VQGEKRTEARCGGHRNSQKGEIAEEVRAAGAGGSWEGRDAAMAGRGERGDGKEGGAWDQATWRGVQSKSEEGVRSKEGGIGGLGSVSAPSETGRVARRAARLAVKQPQTGSR
jgi:hypothetical protein